jgi:hypothetical protein
VIAELMAATAFNDWGDQMRRALTDLHAALSGADKMLQRARAAGRAKKVKAVA